MTASRILSKAPVLNLGIVRPGGTPPKHQEDTALEQTTPVSPGPHRGLLVGLYAACALMVTDLYIRTTAVYPATDLTLLTEGCAWRPFQYRLLLPLIVRGLHAVVPVGLPHLYHALTFVFLLATLLVFRRYLGFFLPGRASDLAALGLLYPLLWNYCVLGVWYYPYDVPTVFFFVAGLVCLLERRWGLYFLVFTLATLNRETTLFLTCASVLTAWGQESPRRMAPHVLAQVAVWGLVRVLLTHLFRHNPGEPVEDHLRRNLALFDPRHLSRMQHGLKVVAVCGACWLLIPAAWRRQPLFFRRLLWIVPLFFAVTLFAGVVNETRLYDEFIPILGAPAIFSVYALWAGPVLSAQPPRRARTGSFCR